jgi:hypothetical protein
MFKQEFIQQRGCDDRDQRSPQAELDHTVDNIIREAWRTQGIRDSLRNSSSRE